MKHENSTVNYVPRNPLWDIFMSRANASALHIIAPPPDVFTSQHTANASVLHIITPQFLCRAFTKSVSQSLMPLCFSRTRHKSSA